MGSNFFILPLHGGGGAQPRRGTRKTPSNRPPAKDSPPASPVHDSQEVKLWYILRLKNREGFHFRRQAPLDGYILDVAEFTHRLIIEVDGSQHGESPKIEKDRRRDEHLTNAGFRVLRFLNNEINQALDGVVLRIEEILRLPPPSR